MATRKRRGRKQSGKGGAIVVLEGTKVGNGEMGVAPLRKAVGAVIDAGEEILVLILLHYNQSTASSGDGYFSSFRRDSYMKFLQEEINQRKECYMQIFMPFHRICKSNGVKLQVKVAAGFRPKDIIIDEANIAKATWIVMDRCFAKDLTFHLRGTKCNVALVSDDEEAVVHNHEDSNDVVRSSVVTEVNSNPKSPKLMKGSIPQEKPDFHNSLPVDESKLEHPKSPSLAAHKKADREGLITGETYKESNNLIQGVPLEKEFAGDGPVSSKVLEVGVMPRQPLPLSLEMIEDFGTRIMIHQLAGDSAGILKAEMKAATSMHHRNILGLIGYHQTANTTLLVFPFAKASLDNYICGLREKIVELKFHEKMKIAIGIAEAVRYMHEECPGGPIIHGELLARNIYIRRDLQPMISGFGKSRLLHLGQASEICNQRCQIMAASDFESMDLLKSDIFSYGVLLLRMFFGTSIQQNDKSLIELARPLMRKGALHELLDEDLDIDTHGIYRVMSATTQCTRTRADLRPSMSEVISILKGEDFCAGLSSPSIDGNEYLQLEDLIPSHN